VALDFFPEVPLMGFYSMHIYYCRTDFNHFMVLCDRNMITDKPVKQPEQYKNIF